MSTFFRVVGMVVGLTLLVASGGMLAFSLVTSPRMNEPGDPLGNAVLAAGTLIGILLVRLSAPGFLSRVLSVPLAVLRRLFTRSALAHPIGLAVWTLIVGTLLLAVPVIPRLFTVLFGFIAYLIVAMVFLAIRPGWWVRAVLTLLAGPIVMMGLMGISETFEPKSVGEGSLAVAGVLMWSWGGILVTGVIRLLIAARSSPQASATNQ